MSYLRILRRLSRHQEEEWQGILLKVPFGLGVDAIPFTSPEDLMKILPKAMSNMFREAFVELTYF
jgi:hypothetical protein